MKKSKKRLLIIIPIIFVIFFIFYLYSYPYSLPTSYTRIWNVDDSPEIKKLREISEVDEFVKRYQNTNLVMGISKNPIATIVHASGGYTGLDLIIYSVFDMPLGMKLVCWSDVGDGGIYSTDIMNHIKNNSCTGM